jgi:hypothetical protein
MIMMCCSGIKTLSHLWHECLLLHKKSKGLLKIEGEETTKIIQFVPTFAKDVSQKIQ